MYLSHIFMRYFEGNKNDSEQICAPLRLLKYSLITVFYPKVIVECVPKWITFPLSLAYSLHLSFSSPLSCHSCPFIAFILLPFPRSPFLHLMAYTCQPSGRGTAVTKWNASVLRPMLFLPELDHSVLLTVHNPNPLSTHLSKPPLSASPFICLSASSL